MDELDGIVSLVSFASTVIPKEAHGREWEEIMEECGVPWRNLWRHGGA
jgi:hypothetical protein